MYKRQLLLHALQEASLKFTDIQPVYLTPADARAVSYTHLTLPTTSLQCRSRWSQEQ
ncbi:hypothetical protein [Enterobacter cloacae complex sp.6701988]|uniref:hypothetical protein n=1 Tax=Enterobacter cloacae complex sp.6701988 TaxID=3397175 RepID=UPI003AAF2D87